MPRPPQQVDFMLIAQAGDLARKQSATLSARSLTAKEVAAKDRFLLVWGTPIYLGIMLVPLILLASQGGREVEAVLPVLLLIIYCGTILVAGVGVYRARRRSAYRDPHITLEVTPANLTIRDPDHEFVLDYAELEISFEKMAMWDRYGKHVFFLGIALSTALGPLRLRDDWFLSGKAAAAMIVERCTKDGMFTFA